MVEGEGVFVSRWRERVAFLEFCAVGLCSCGELAADGVLGFSNILIYVIEVEAADGTGGRHGAGGKKWRPVLLESPNTFRKSYAIML